jgi:hypothetical protein
MKWVAYAIDFVLAYPQAELKVPIFMRIPKGCTVPGASAHTHVLRLLRNLYGLKDAGRTWHEHIRQGLLDRGFQQSVVDPCFFYSNNIILLLYVDDAAIFAPTRELVDTFIQSLRKDFALTIEGELKDYLGVRIAINKDGSIAMTQPRIIKRCLALVGMDRDASVKIHDTPADATSILQSDSKGPERKQTWNYRAIIGLLNYLQGMTRPDISYAVHQCARFCANPKSSHEIAVKRICRYLMGTKSQGLVFQPSADPSFQCFVDADWAGNWDKRFATDPSIARSRTGYVLTFANCPIAWASRLQSLVALSTTEAEYIALSTALREVLALMNLFRELEAKQFIKAPQPRIRCTVFEDNQSCICLATEPKARPRTKHLAVRLHHFRDHVLNGDITIQHVASKDQTADIFTKPLPREQFKALRLKLCGW